MGGDADGKWIPKTYLGVLLVVFASLLFTGTVASRKVDRFRAISALADNLDHVVAAGRGRRSVPASPDLVNVSERRVPSGPDPIHNRHVGETRRPPGRTKHR